MFSIFGGEIRGEPLPAYFAVQRTIPVEIAAVLAFIGQFLHGFTPFCCQTALLIGLCQKKRT